MRFSIQYHRHRDPELEMPPTTQGSCSSSNDGGTGKRVTTRGHEERRAGWMPQLVTLANGVMKRKELAGKGQMMYISPKRTPTRPHSHRTCWLGDARREMEA